MSRRPSNGELELTSRNGIIQPSQADSLAANSPLSPLLVPRKHLVTLLPDGAVGCKGHRGRDSKGGLSAHSSALKRITPPEAFWRVEWGASASLMYGLPHTR